MTVGLREYEQLKSTATRLQREADKAEGAHAEQLKQLEDKYECSTVKEAEQLLRTLTKQVNESEAKFKKLLNKFEDDWADILEQH
jgi:uncharacterized protein YqiB (DUF1249 family)